MNIFVLSVYSKRNTFRGILIFLSLLCSGRFSPCFSEEKGEHEPVYLMEEIVVTSRSGSPSTESVLEKEDIQALQPVSVADILAGSPGASVIVGTKNSSDILIHGYNSSEVLIMVDGRPINEPYYGKLDLSTIGVGNISRIRVVKGSSSVRYGPNAMGGVVNIMTGGTDDGPPVSARFTTGSGKDFRADFIHRGRIRNVGYRINFGRTVRGGFPLSSDFTPTSLENGGLRDNSFYRQTDMGIKLLFGPRETPKWSVNLGNSHLSKGLPSSIYEPRFWRFRTWNRTSLDLDGVPVRGDTFRVKTKVYIERFLNEFVDYRDGSYDPYDVYWESTHDNLSAGFLVSSSYAQETNGITNTGLQIRWENSRRQAEKGIPWFENSTATTWMFAEHERMLADGLRLRGGISGDVFVYDSRDRITHNINPSVNLEWKFRDYTITGAVSRVSRFPTLHQLFSSDSGNPCLKPEWAYKGDLTVSRDFYDTVTFSATGFMNRVHDMIFRSGNLGIYHNIEEARLDGAEISGEIRVLPLKAASAATLLDSRSRDGERLEYRPEWKVDTNVSWTIFPGLSATMISRIVGERRTEINTYLPSYHTESIGLVIGENHTVAARLMMDNIFDVSYEEEFGYPTAGRTVLAAIDWSWGGK